MGRVVLRMTGTTSFQVNAQRHPPRGQAAQAKQSIPAGKRRSVITANCLGQTVSFKEMLKTLRTVSLRAFSNARASRTYRLCSSRTVSGSHRLASFFHQPLKSTVHTSLAAPALRPVLNRPASVERCRRRFWVKPARSSTRLKLLSQATCHAAQIQLPNLARSPRPVRQFATHDLAYYFLRQLLADGPWAAATVRPCRPNPPG